jgi:hypothetical protein
MKKYLGEYARSFGAAGFSRHKDLYIASGLLSYNASSEMSDMLRFLGPHARSVQYKERYLPREMLAALNPEQEALVDFLVLANADNFVGLGSSTFSVYLRCVGGRSRALAAAACSRVLHGPAWRLSCSANGNPWHPAAVCLPATTHQGVPCAAGPRAAG